MLGEENGEAEPSASTPFFAIDPIDAPSSDEHQPTLVGGSPPMAPIQVGELGGSSAQGTAPASQLTGEVNHLQGMFQLQPTTEVAKETFRWGQFFIGLFAPHTVFFVLAIVASVMGSGGEDMPDFYRYDDVSLSPDGEGWYNFTVEKSPAESVNFDIDLGASYPEYRSVVMYYWIDDGDWGDNGSVYETSYDSTNGDYSETEIGEYTYANQTVWFKLDGSDVQTYNVTIVFHDLAAEEAWWDENGGAEDVFSFLLFCGMPVAFVIGTVAAFVRGNRALGIGLLSAIPASFIFLPAMAILLLIMFGL
jgi:hypothetical protein